MSSHKASLVFGVSALSFVSLVGCGGGTDSAQDQSAGDMGAGAAQGASEETSPPDFEGSGTPEGAGANGSDGSGGDGSGAGTQGAGSGGAPAGSGSGGGVGTGGTDGGQGSGGADAGTGGMTGSGGGSSEPENSCEEVSECMPCDVPEDVFPGDPLSESCCIGANPCGVVTSKDRCEALKIAWAEAKSNGHCSTVTCFGPAFDCKPVELACNAGKCENDWFNRRL